MWVQEIEFDISQDPAMCLSEGGFQNVGDTTVAELRIAAEDEFGAFVEDIIDPDNDGVRIGWKFRTTATYEDSSLGGEFQLETWIILHDEPPEMKFKYHVIEDTELADVEKFQSIVSDAELVDDPSTIPSTMPVSVQEAMASLGMSAGDAENYDDTDDVDDVDE